jgi:FtsP/CotA-like multicopper oxidase with cupredoxin domain
MTEADELRVQNVGTDKAAPAKKEPKARAARREFLRQALAVTSCIGLSELLPASLLRAAPQTTCPATLPPTLIPVGEITHNGNKLQAVIRVVNGDRIVPGVAMPTMLRYYKGHNPANPSQKWPPDTSTAPGPGPTLRCEIGDEVQITFLNQVNVMDFPGTLATGDYGTANGCDERTNVQSPTSTIKDWYPAKDKFPNCLHASSSANIHFHGTHVTPSTTGDNVLVNIWPNTNVTETDVQGAFRQVFEECDIGHIAQKWEDLPLGWRLYQERLIREYDATAPYVGPGANRDGHGLPWYLRLWPQNEEAIKQGVWPPYYVGSYPYCFKIPRYEGLHHGLQMGQAPGTHWYHSHKHGSTALNMFNGLSGALIIEDNSPAGYDGKLNAYYGSDSGGKPNLEQVVLVFQQITGVPNLLASSLKPLGAPPILVNGQFTPTITMKQGQVKLWRMINATVQTFITAVFQPCSGTATLKFNQTAQDGVQFDPANYDSQPLTNKGQNPLFNMAPANRIDLLVQAPTTAGLHVLQILGKPGKPNVPILYVNVTDSGPPMPFPKVREFPILPDFLHDIVPRTIRLRREVTYGWNKGTNKPGRIMATGEAPQFNIDGKQFEDQVINQVMLLDTAEEWTIYNATMDIAHPFHIHVNPFQIVEVFNPATMTAPQKLSPPYVWWDTFAIPPGVPDPKDPETDPLKRKIIPGYFKMRSRFVDFTGQYVQHCHILSHEDRGMMQLLEVVSNKTVTKHH